jgi:hypothetical protein
MDNYFGAFQKTYKSTIMVNQLTLNDLSADASQLTKGANIANIVSSGVAVANAMTQLGVARITSQAGVITEQERKKRNELILVGGFVIATGLIITYLVVKKF